MPEPITLELSEATFSRVQQLADRAGQTVETLLTSWIEHNATVAEDIYPLVAGATYEIVTPLGNDAAAAVLLQTLLGGEKAIRTENSE